MCTPCQKNNETFRVKAPTYSSAWNDTLRREMLHGVETENYDENDDDELEDNTPVSARGVGSARANVLGFAT
jgi:hypothetical protein